MPRKESITLSHIRETAFQMGKEVGYEEVTTRKLAERAGCSTQPIFRVYKNMDALKKDMLEDAVLYFEEYYDKAPKGNYCPFVNLGLTYIRFASEEKHLFRFLFLNTSKPEGLEAQSFYEILNGKNGNVVKEINQAKESGCRNAQQLFMKMWIFIHGAACMTITGDYDLSEKETIAMLEEVYRSFLF